MAFYKHILYTGLSDEDLMRYVARGKEKAFTELYRRYGNKMLIFFYQRLYQDKEKAEDFLHDLFLKIIENPQSFNTNKKFSTWIYAVAYNQCKNEYRKNASGLTKKERYTLDSSLDICENPSFENDYDLKTFSESLELELQKMDDKHGLTFILRHQDGLAIKEISKIMQCSEGTVKSRLFYAIKRLAQKLQIFNGQIKNN